MARSDRSRLWCGCPRRVSSSPRTCADGSSPASSARVIRCRTSRCSWSSSGSLVPLSGGLPDSRIGVDHHGAPGSTRVALGSWHRTHRSPRGTPACCCSTRDPAGRRLSRPRLARGVRGWGSWGSGAYGATRSPRRIDRRGCRPRGRRRGVRAPRRAAAPEPGRPRRQRDPRGARGHARAHHRGAQRAFIASHGDNQDKPAARAAHRAYTKLLAHLRSGDAIAAQDFWRKHLDGIEKYMVGDSATTLVEVLS